MTAIQDIFITDIVDKLKTITTSNGFGYNLSVLDSYVTLHVEDLKEGVGGIGFPCAAVHPKTEQTSMNKSQTKAKLSRVFSLIGIVSTQDKSKINSQINQMIYDIRNVLAIDKYDNLSKSSDIELGDVVFNLPDPEDEYVSFEMSLNVNYVETWR